MAEQVEIHVEQGKRGRWRFKVVLMHDLYPDGPVDEAIALSPVYGWDTQAGATAAAHRFIRLMRQRNLLTMRPIPVKAFDRMAEDGDA